MPPTYTGEFPGGHTVLSQDHGVEYVYYCNPYPLIRMPADPDQLGKIGSCEAFTCLKPGTRIAQQQLDRGPDGALRYAWKTNTQFVLQDQQNKLISSRLIKPDETLLNLRDLDSGKTVIAHGGSVYWNEYRQRWVMIAVEARGSTSYLGEVWYAEADTLLGPWVYARKIVTHDKYSFYNPKQHPMFDQEKGRTIFFEGTYATTFSGNPDATPRYDYNQIMYQLELTDRRLALPVAVYRIPFSPGAAARLVLTPPPSDRATTPPRQVLFFAPDKEGIASLPVYEQYDPLKGETLRVGTGDRTPDSGVRPLFFLLPADIKDYTGATVPLYEHQAEGSEERFYSVDTPSSNARSRWTSKVLGRVWRNPARHEALVRIHRSFGVRTNPVEAQGRTTMDSPWSELGWLEEIIEQLEHDPEECWQALEGLASVESDVRLAVIEALSRHRLRPGVARLLRLLSSMREPVESQAPRVAIEAPEVAQSNRLSIAEPTISGLESECLWATSEVGELSRTRPWVAARVGDLAGILPRDASGRSGSRHGRDLSESGVAKADCRVPVRRAKGNHRRHRRGRARVARSR